MKALFLLIIAVVGLAAVPCVSAQSRRVAPTRSNEKRNQDGRPKEASPTPTPTPAAEPVDDGGDVISIDTRLISIPVRVLDRKNRFIGGLKKENFRIFEDGVEQELGYFTNEAQPFTVALVLDMSYSSAFKIEDIQNAAISFINQLRPEDKVMVVSFDEEVHMLTEATSDRQRIYAAIRSTRIATGTSLYEAVDLVMNSRMRSIQGRKAIVLFTDGVDTTSRRTDDRQNLHDAMELDALIYPIRYDTYADVQAMKDRPPVVLPPGLPVPDKGAQLPGSTPTTLPTSLPFPLPTRRPRDRDPRDTGRDNPDDPTLPPTRPPIRTPRERGTTAEEYRYAEVYLDKLAESTGGQIYQAPTFGHLNDAFARIASELREFYSIGYYPKDEAAAGTTRRIKVKVDRPNVAVRARDSYVVAKSKN
ncbi:MAG: VWA domain-containing protein [Acidobacteria bacterium]|nr:VWA domain-containing protein [Acidobacteriota bacterium]